jgi:TP901 family phage tail tape measure protein
MAKKIKKEDIIEGSLLGSTIKETQDLINLIDVLKKDLRKLKNEAKTGLKDNPLGSPEQVKKFNDQQTQANLLIKEGNRLRKAEATAKAKLKALNSQEAINVQKVRIATAERNKQIKQSIQLNKAQEGSIKSLRIQLSKQTKAYDELSKAERENVKIGGRQLKQIQATQKELRGLEDATGRAQRNVGNYGAAWSKVGKNLLRLTGVVGGAMIFKDAFTRIKDFEQAQADLQAISGKTEEDLASLTKQAKELGAVTQFSASEIVSLQIELAKLGFTTKEIEQSTKGVQNFAAATGTDLATAAKLSGSALRAFNLESSEMDRVVSTLGVATTKTALDVSQLETGLSTVAPVAATFGFSIEETTALLGQLSNAGFDASSSATATRNILLNLADSNGKLAQALGKPVKNIDELAKGLKELDDKGIDLAGTLELTDKRSVAAFNTFIKGSDSLVSLTESITNQNQALQEMADKRLDTVAGSLKLLNSAWEAFLLNLNDSSGAFNGIKTAIQFVAKNLTTIIKVLTLGASAWASYKLAIIASNVVTKAYTATTTAAKIVTALFSKGLKGATGAFRGLNTVMKANVFGLVVTAITTALTALSLFNDETEEGIEKQKELDDAAKKTGATLENRFAARLKLSKSALEALKSDLEDSKRQEEETLANAQSVANAQNEIIKARIDFNKKELEDIKEGIKVRRELGVVKKGEVDDDQVLVDLLLKKIEADEKDLKLIKETTPVIQRRVEQIDVLNKLLKDNNKESGKREGLIKANIESLKELRKIEKEATSAEQLLAIQKKITLLEEENKAYLSRVDIFKDLEEVEDDDFSDEDLEAQTKKRKTALEKATDVLLGVFEKEDVEAEEHQDNQTEIVAEGIHDRLDLEAEAAEARRLLANQSADAALDYFKQTQNEKIDLINKEIDASKEKERQLFEAAKNGNVLANESIALERKNRAKLEEERLRSARKIRNAELLLAGVRTLGAVSSAGSANPAQDTISQITIVKSFLDNLPAFIDGTENVADGVKGATKISNGTDGYLARFDGKERILNPEQNSRLGGMSNEDLTTVGEMYQSGAFNYLSFKQEKFKSHNATDNSLMAIYAMNNMSSKLDDVNRSIKNIPVPHTEWNGIIKGISETTETMNNLKRKHFKPKNIM